MPELPEVETVVRGLRSSLPGRTITAVRLGKSDFIDDPAALGEQLPGKRVMAVERIGKFICIELAPVTGNQRSSSPDQSDERLLFIVHLGMTGRFGVRPPEEPAPPHTHGFFDLDNGNELRYTDIRRFGRMLLLPKAGLPEFQARFGDDALFVSRETFARKLAGRRARIKAFLLDQTALRGMGNIYADESLWRAGIHPEKLASNLKSDEAARLHQAIRQVLKAAIKLGGSSISDFLDAEGKAGSYQHRHRVYGREGEKCFRCGAAIKRIIVAGRSSHFCPKCQKAPRVRTKPTKRTTPSRVRTAKRRKKRTSR
jgi:formamidopyrimidine-DNA glycosylase